MGRTSIDLDDALIAEVMRRFAFTTKREAVHFVLTRLIGGRISRDDALRLQGSGWYGDLAAMRTDRNDRTDRRGGVDA